MSDVTGARQVQAPEGDSMLFSSQRTAEIFPRRFVRRRCRETGQGDTNYILELMQMQIEMDA